MVGQQLVHGRLRQSEGGRGWERGPGGRGRWRRGGVGWGGGVGGGNG